MSVPYLLRVPTKLWQSLCQLQEKSRLKLALEMIVTEEPISPEFRLAIALYRLSRGDYYYTIAEMTGLGVSTMCTIVNEVTRTIVDNLWGECIGQQLPKSEEHFKEKIVDMEEQWQFCCCWAAVDG